MISYRAKPRSGLSDSERFWMKVVKSENGCWNWIAGKSNGYGSFRVKYDGRQRSIDTHLYVWTLENGKPPSDCIVHHKCDNRACVRLDHLELIPRKKHPEISSKCVAYVNSRKTHCKNGHPFDDENVYLTSKGHRQCRTCREINFKNFYELNKDKLNFKKSNKINTHCKYGHEYTEENIIITSNGKKLCLLCLREFQRRCVESKNSKKDDLIKKARVR